MRYLILVLFPLLATCFADAQCKWEKTELSVGVAISDAQAKTEFPFSNDGDGPIKIVRVLPSCGCTTAQLSISTLQPGESGVLRAVVNIGNEVGQLSKSILVEAQDDQGKITSTKLTININIPNPLTITPMAISWKKDEVPAPKTIHLKSTVDFPIHITSIESSHSTIVSAIKTIADGKEYEIQITPVETIKRLDATLILHTDLKTSGPEKRFAIDAAVE